jgi:hypothetical protein
MSSILRFTAVAALVLLLAAQARASDDDDVDVEEVEDPEDGSDIGGGQREQLMQDGGESFQQSWQARAHLNEEHAIAYSTRIEEWLFWNDTAHCVSLSACFSGFQRRENSDEKGG